ncbi:hypothetical protein DKM44_07640 [Deinococcus irradiatisoli]|uniref:HD-GYP domain-containing protein n=2 Tax=Deinococcus irradiatisoli TaxID=2202254 RepID=A0A2Z3JD60_9DEIO|nr:hypothetical protein DKM44_07640 [Deinococcus irradiatisoli]
MKAARPDHPQRATPARTLFETRSAARAPLTPQRLSALLRAETLPDALDRALTLAAQLGVSGAGVVLRQPALRRGHTWPGARQLEQQVVASRQAVQAGAARGLPVFDNGGRLLGVLVLQRGGGDHLPDLEQLTTWLGLTLERLLLREQVGDLEERGARLGQLTRILDSHLTLPRKAEKALEALKVLCGVEDVRRLPLNGAPRDFPPAPASPAPLRSLHSGPWEELARQTLEHDPRVRGRWLALEDGRQVLLVGLRAGQQVSEAWLLLGRPQDLTPAAGALLSSAARRVEQGLERRAQRRSAQARRQTTELLTALPLSLEGAVTPEQMAERGLNILMALSGLGCGAYLQLDQATGEVHPHLYAASGPAQVLDEAQSTALLAAARQVMRNQRALLKRAGDLRCLLAPLRCEGRTVGALALCQPSGAWPPDTKIIRLLRMVARRVGAALERRETLSELSRTREQALYSLGQALGYRSAETQGHTERVTALALRLGVALDLDFETLRDLRWGAYLHDIGKIAIPDALLLKAGALSAAEKRQMSVHVTLGEQMLRAQGFVPEAVCQVVRHHHERWDGGGYPDGLRGEQIPLLARVFAVADVYDALISARAYKPHWSRQRALAELRRAAGHHLDPQVVARFVQLMDGGS